MGDSNEVSEYLPSPIDLSEVALPLELQILVEELAEKTHDIWAAGRLAEGWTWGPSRCAERLHHPCLVPYEALPDTEKNYDRASVVSTLQMVLALGYRIVKDSATDASSNF